MFACSGCTKKQPYRIPKYFPSEAVATENDIIHYNGSSPSPAMITLQENGESYQVYAAEGQLIVLFDENITHEEAIRTLKSINAKIIAQIPYLKYYLVEVPVGEENTFLVQLQKIHSVEFVYPNAIEQICSVNAYVMDNFNVDHGSMVASMLSGCNPILNTKTYNISDPGDEKGVNTYKAIEYTEQILKNADKRNGAVINMSFGSDLVKLWAIIPWQHRVLWNDRFVTEDNKISYKKRYINGLKVLINLATRYDDKNFVIVKSAGNEGMKKLELVIEDLKSELSFKQRRVFEKHFILASAKDDNKERDYPNDVSAYHKMVTKADISDMTAHDLHWQGTSFSTPRIAGYIATAAENYELTVTDVLQYARNATEKAANNVLTYELLEAEIGMATHYDSEDDGKEIADYSYNEKLADDLVGQKIYDPSENGYFPQEWRWTLESGEVLGVDVLNRETTLDESHIRILAHLHRGYTQIDADILMHYVRYGSDFLLQSTTVNRIIIPNQTNYAQYVSLKMDYDFFPTLTLYNNSNMTLFVGGDYSSGDKQERFGCIVGPNSSESVAIGAIQSYHLHFAYRK